MLQIVIGAIVTVISLLVISASTKSSHKENLTTRINQGLLEDEEDNYERLDPVTTRNGEIL